MKCAKDLILQYFDGVDGFWKKIFRVTRNEEIHGIKVRGECWPSYSFGKAFWKGQSDHSIPKKTFKFIKKLSNFIGDASYCIKNRSDPLFFFKQSRNNWFFDKSQIRCYSYTSRHKNGPMISNEDIPAQTVNRLECNGRSSVNSGFWIAQNRHFCLWTYPSRW